VVVGILIAGFGGWEIYNVQINKAVGSFILAAVCVAIGLFSRAAETRKS
jgi:hypothetical protein